MCAVKRFTARLAGTLKGGRPWPTHRPVQYERLVIERIVQETPDARSFVLRVPPELGARFAYRAGQFLTFRVPWEGGHLVRCYSLASCPETEAEWKVTVKRVDEGRVSNWFHDQLEPGKEIEVLPPAGRFVLRESDAPLLLFAGGSGITPVVSLLKAALATTSRTARLLYANRDRSSIIFHDELDALAARHPGRLQIVHRLDDADGFLEADAARDFAGGSERSDAYICGPGPFMDVVEVALAGLGFDADRIFIERFESPADGDVPAVALGAAVPAGAPGEITVRLAGEERSVPYTAGQRILHAVRDAGLDPPFACEEGYCGSCAAKVRQGRVTMVANDVFSAAEVAQGWVLTCQARAEEGPCEVSYDD